ncbi:MAG: AsmA-like C-terminal region-containing protein [bacterium]
MDLPNTETQRTQREKTEKKKPVLIFTAVVLLAAIGAGGWFWGKPKLKSFIVENVKEEIEHNFPLRAEVSDVSFSLPRSVALKKITFISRSDGTPVLSADEISAAISLSQLLKGKVTLGSISCDKPILYFVRRADGSTNLDAFLDKRKGKLSHPLLVRLTDAKLVFKDYYKKSLPAALEFYAIEAAFKLHPSKPLRIVKASAKYGKSDFLMKGYIGTGEGEAVKLSITSEKFLASDLNLLASSVAGFKIQGVQNLNAPLSVRIKVDGARGGENITISASANEGRIGSRKISNIKVIAAGTREMFEIRSLAVRLQDGGKLAGTLSYPLVAGEPLEANMRCENFPAEVLYGFAPDLKGGVTGSLTGDLRLQGDIKKKDTLKGDGSFHAVSGILKGASGGEPLQYDAMEGNFQIGDGKLSVKRFLLKSAEIDLALDGTVGLDGALNLNGRAEVIKEKVRTSTLKKIVSTVIADGSKGYVFKMKISGTTAEPKIEYSPLKTIYRGLEDQVRDAGNKMERLIKKIF